LHFWEGTAPEGAFSGFGKVPQNAKKMLPHCEFEFFGVRACLLKWVAK